MPHREERANRWTLPRKNTVPEGVVAISRRDTAFAMARQPHTRQCPWPVLAAPAAAPPMKPTTALASGYHHRHRCQSLAATSVPRNQPASLQLSAPPVPNLPQSVPPLLSLPLRPRCAPLARREGAAGHGLAALAGHTGHGLAIARPRRSPGSGP
jgi:hypothetical protein